MHFVNYYCTFLKTSTVKCLKRFCIYLYSRNISTEGERKTKNNSIFFISKNFVQKNYYKKKKNLVLNLVQTRKTTCRDVKLNFVGLNIHQNQKRLESLIWTLRVVSSKCHEMCQMTKSLLNNKYTMIPLFWNQTTHRSVWKT